MPGGSLVSLARRVQLGGTVLADGLQRAVAGSGRVRGGDQQALIGEPGQRGRDRTAGRRRPAGQHGLRRGRGERGREHRDPAQHRPVGLVEQGVAPVERGPERAVPVVRPRAAGQQVHPVGQPGLNPVQAERRTRAAVSSIASATPSRPRQMAATRPASASVSALPAAAARVRNNSTASPGPPSPAAMDSPGTGNTHSNGTRSRARLVTSTDSRGLPASSR